MSDACVVLICGSRHWTDPEPIRRVLERLPGGSLVITGGQRSYDRDTGVYYGADYIAEREAREMHLHVATVPAQWKVFGRAAGPRRNQAISLLLPAVSCVYGFPLGSSAGTAGMLALARHAGTRVVVYRDGEFSPPLGRI